MFEFNFTKKKKKKMKLVVFEVFSSRYIQAVSTNSFLCNYF